MLAIAESGLSDVQSGVERTMDRFAQQLLSLAPPIAAALACCATLGNLCPLESAESPVPAPAIASDGSTAAFAATNAAASSARAGIGDLLAQLDSPRYSVRVAAKAKFEELLARPETALPVLAECRDALQRADLSFEVRRQLAHWLKQASETATEPAESEPTKDRPISLSLNDLQREVIALTSDSFARREAARVRLSEAWRNSKTCIAALEILSDQLDANISDPADLMELQSAFEAAAARWLLAQPETRLTHPVGPDRIERWISLISSSAESNDPILQQRAMAAVAQLQVALADDRSTRLAIEALRRRLAGPLAPAARQPLAELAELAHPAMVAEYWADGRHQGEQHLLVGVASQAPGAARPSHFDRIDDQWAHCISGNTLTPGLYPSNVAVPHPMSEQAFFHLVNLPRPRDRLAYPHRAKQDDSARLKQISRRTFNRMLDPPRPLTEAETVMLAQLDSSEVARFAGEYFAKVGDGPFADHLGPLRLGGRPSRFGLLCAVLAERPDRRAAPGLLEAIEQRRFAPPTSACPYRMEYLAALAIALRDPWEGVDQWLATQAAEAIDLVEDQRKDPPALAGTAAALLLQRRQAARDGMGLYPVADPLLSALGIEGHRFARPDDRHRFAAWWKSQKSAP